MKPITLIATDLDGTFLNSKKQVTSLNKEAVSKLKQYGILFGIASGRPVETVRAMLKEWQIEDSVSFIMGMNGGVLYDLRQRTKEEYHLLDGEVVLDIIHFFEDLDVDFWILEGATRYTNRTSIETQEHARIFGETEIEIDLEPYLLNNTCNKLIIHCDKEYMPIVLERAKQYKNEACVGFLTADNLFEYVDPRINKGYGIEKVAKHFGVKLENCVAFGDEQNDMEMLQKVGMGVCMKNGSKQVKDCGAFVSAYTNDESAVAHFIEENILKEDMDVIL